MRKQKEEWSGPVKSRQLNRTVCNKNGFVIPHLDLLKRLKRRGGEGGMDAKEGEKAADAAAASPSSPTTSSLREARKLSCTKHFDALWFCYCTFSFLALPCFWLGLGVMVRFGSVIGIVDNGNVESLRGRAHSCLCREHRCKCVSWEDTSVLDQRLVCHRLISDIISWFCNLGRFKMPLDD